MKRTILCGLAMLVCATCTIGQVANTAPGAATSGDAYAQLHKSGKGLKTAGFITGGTGLVLMAVGLGQATGEAAQTTTNVIGGVLGGGPIEEPDENKGKLAFWSGTAMLVGGVAMLISGSNKLQKARRLQASSGMSLKPFAPPAKLGRVLIPQQGLTMTIVVGRR